ncbi:MAG: DUF2127 domain-containing protein [Patescibacteria group bacterium]|jgi:uncharacterized membrane protein
MPIREKTIHFLLKISLWFKSAFAVVEIIGGLLFYFTSNYNIVKFIYIITSSELGEDPKDIVANYLINFSHTFFQGTQQFIVFYLLSHGIVKLAVIIGLLKNKLWAYPASIFVFTAFIFYQIYRFNFTHSIWLLVLTVIDALIVWMVWKEYLFVGRKKWN